MLSVSDLLMHHSCARRLYLRNKMKPCAESSRKNLLQRNFSIIKNEQEIISGVDPSHTQEDILHIYISRILESSAVEAHAAVHPGAELFLKQRAAQVHKFASANRLFGSQLAKRIIPQCSMLSPVESKGLRGVVDAVLDFGSHLVPLQIKSGKAPSNGVWDADRLQMAAYMMMLSENKNVPEGRVLYAGSKEERRVVLNVFMEQKVEALRDEAERTLRNQEMPPRIEDKRRCARCAVREVCFS